MASLPTYVDCSTDPVIHIIHRTIHKAFPFVDAEKQATIVELDAFIRDKNPTFKELCKHHDLAKCAFDITTLRIAPTLISPAYLNVVIVGFEDEMGWEDTTDYS